MSCLRVYLRSYQGEGGAVWEKPLTNINFVPAQGLMSLMERAGLTSYTKKEKEKENYMNEEVEEMVVMVWYDNERENNKGKGKQ